MSENTINTDFDYQLSEDNEKVCKDLSECHKKIEFLEIYRKFFIKFSESCVCGKSSFTKCLVKSLESHYSKTFPKSDASDEQIIGELFLQSDNIDTNNEVVVNKLEVKNEISVQQNVDKNPKNVSEVTDPTEKDIKLTKESTHSIIIKSSKSGQTSDSAKILLVLPLPPSDSKAKRKRQIPDSAKKGPRRRKVINGAELKSNLKIYQEMKEIFCPEVDCGKQFKCMQNLRKHTKTVHLNLRPFPCDWPGCESAFKTREAMTNHKSIHSNERNFKCEVEGCNKSFKIRCKLTQHMRCHGVGPKNERFPCSWPACGQFCASEQALTEHLNRHQNIRPYICQFNGCGKSYFTSFELRQHSMKFHEQSESFSCDYKECTMSFLNKRDLAKHRRLHIDVARFVCSWPECCHTFNTSRDLSDHMNRHMDIKANKCHFLGCDRSYFTKKDLMRHIKQAHS